MIAIDSGSCRLLSDVDAASLDRRTGPWNMGVDESLLQHAGGDQAVLRFYDWALPTLSLGYFQDYADRLQHPASAAAPCVRRASGGGAILHHHELTYSLVVPHTVWPAARNVDLYRVVHDALVATLADVCRLTATLQAGDGIGEAAGVSLLSSP